MATNPKMAPCPECGTGDYLSVYTYENSGNRRVVCDRQGCWYMGPPEGSVRQAIKSHNESCAAGKEGRPSPEEEADMIDGLGSLIHGKP